MRLAAIGAELDGELRGRDIGFGAVCTDTRSLRQGELFLALAGENFDGNEFVPEAFRRGAAAAVVGRFSDADLPQLRVADTGLALARIAGANRARSTATVLAVTGSQGKTTVKEMLGAILALEGPSLVTRANLNNTVGVPLTLLGLAPEHRFAVIEMGANRAGEIAFCAAAAAPDIALITGAAMAHTEGFGGLAGVVRAKGEIIDGLKADGVLLLNAGDPNVGAWRERGGAHRIREFSLREVAGKSSCFARQIELNSRGQPAFTLVTPGGETRIRLALLGEHNIANAVAAAAAAIEAGAGIESVRAGLESTAPAPGRLRALPGRGGPRLIDDSYNANPDSFRAAIDLLAALPGPRLLIAGDMLELGPGAAAMHREIGRHAAESGIEWLWATGDLCAHMVAGFGPDGRHFASRSRLAEALGGGAIAEEGVVLVKGSRGARMDEIAAQLRKGGGG